MSVGVMKLVYRKWGARAVCEFLFFLKSDMPGYVLIVGALLLTSLSLSAVSSMCSDNGPSLVSALCGARARERGETMHL